VLGVPERGEALMAELDTRLQTLRRHRHGPEATWPSAIPWQPRGYTSGPDSLMGAVLRAAGLRDVAAGQRIGVEALVRHKPDLLVLPAIPDLPSRATDLLTHPALAPIEQRIVRPALTLCAGPFTVRAAERLTR
jgi:iron complex transport system substrate-binding protein